MGNVHSHAVQVMPGTAALFFFIKHIFLNYGGGLKLQPLPKGKLGKGIVGTKAAVDRGWLIRQSRSEKIQSAIRSLLTASRAYGRMKTIVDHSFEGITVVQSEFLKQAANDLRAYFAANYPDFKVTDQKELKGLSWPNDTMGDRFDDFAEPSVNPCSYDVNIWCRLPIIGRLRKVTITVCRTLAVVVRRIPLHRC